MTEDKYRKLGNGYFQRTFDDFKEFIEFVCLGSLDSQQYIWRGQRCCDWKLEPAIDRLRKNEKCSVTKEYGFLQQHLEKFQLAARGRRGLNAQAINEENEWWALGQHYGLATPLLDWTTSPFVAAYFAFHEVDLKQTNYRAVFALCQPVLEDWSKDKCLKENLSRLKQREDAKKAGKGLGILNVASRNAIPDLLFIKPMSDENQRLVSQNGLFTRGVEGKSIESMVIDCCHSGNGNETLIKFLIPNKEREQCLRMLNRMNINALSLFPDLSGASRYCNLFSEIENY